MKIERTYGSGPESVYVYYFPSQADGRTSWPCKIGKTRGDPVKRIKRQQASMWEEPVIGLLAQTDNCSRDEYLVHSVLRDRKLDAFGVEWFDTTPDEVLAVFRDRARGLSLGMQLRMARYERGMTQRHVSDAAGISQTTVSKIELDQSAQLRTVYDCARALGMRIELVKDGDEADPGGASE